MKRFLSLLPLCFLLACSNQHATNTTPLTTWYPIHLVDNPDQVDDTAYITSGYINADGRILVTAKGAVVCPDPYQARFAIIGFEQLDPDQTLDQYRQMKQFGLPDTRFGLMTPQGTWRIPPQYDSIIPQPDGLFITQNDYGYGLLDQNANPLIAPSENLSQLDNAGEGLCSFEVDNLFGYVDYAGHTIIKPHFTSAGRFNRGLAPCQDAESHLFGYIDHSGKWVIPPQFKMAGSFTDESLAQVADAAGMFHIDIHGKPLYPQRFPMLFDFSEGLAPAAIKDPTDHSYVWGYISTSGDFTIPPQFALASPFSQGLAPVMPDPDSNQWIFINTRGTQAFPTRFTSARPFMNNLAPVNTCQYINKQGHILPFHGLNTHAK